MLELLPNPRLIGARRDLLLQKDTDLSQTLLLRLPRVRRRRHFFPDRRCLCSCDRAPQREREREMESKESVKTTVVFFVVLKVDFIYDMARENSQKG